MDLLITYQLRRDGEMARTIDTKIIREVHMRDDDELLEQLESELEEIVTAVMEEIEK